MYKEEDISIGKEELTALADDDNCQVLLQHQSATHAALFHESLLEIVASLTAVNDLSKEPSQEDT